jgi:hypothetical protein
MFFAWNFFTLGATNAKPNEYKNQPNGKKKESFSLLPFPNGFLTFKILMSYIFNQMHYMNIVKHRCTLNYLSMKENWIVCIV